MQRLHALVFVLLWAGSCGLAGAAEPDSKPVAAATATAAPAERPLFDGKTLNGWAVTPFAGHGEVRVNESAIVMEQGYMTGVHWTNALPRTNYELSLEARRMQGSDFFCGLTFPMAGTNVSLIIGGWGGGVVGISSIDDNDASSNETTRFMGFEKGRWYSIRVKVTPEKLEAWLDAEKIVDLKTEGRKFGLRSGPIEESVPLGICTYETTGEVRKVMLRELAATTTTASPK